MPEEIQKKGTKGKTTIVLDAGPVISLTTNNLLWILQKFDEGFPVEFVIPEGVKGEIVDTPLNTKRFKFEALQVLKAIENNTINIVNTALVQKKREEILMLANHCFTAEGQDIQILHEGEVEAIAAYLELHAQLLVVDERTTRVLIETPEKLKEYLEHKLHTNVIMNMGYLHRLKEMLKDVHVIRSAELIAIAYEKHILDGLLPNLVNSQEVLLDSLLWGVKLNGCAISSEEIEDLKLLELRQAR